MDFITTTIIASTVYDVLKTGAKLSAGVLKDRLTKWLRDDVMAESVSAELLKLDINEDLSEKAIEKRIDQSQCLRALIDKINANISIVAPATATTLMQTHSGNGDNVGGNKIVN